MSGHKQLSLSSKLVFVRFRQSTYIVTMAGARFAPISAVRRIAMRLSSLSTRRPNDVDLAALTHWPTTLVHNLGSRLRCVKCAKVGIHLG
jgi:hypothetical protein